MKLSLNILEFLKLIPNGKIMTYANLANTFGLKNGQRQIGHILSKNKDIDIYPCYKIVHNDSRVGDYLACSKTKYRHMKIDRLKKDGIYILNEKVLNLEKYIWKPKITNMFLAIDINDEVKDIIQKAQRNIMQEFKEIDDILSFQNSQMAHITIYFLGNVFENIQSIVQSFKSIDYNFNNNILLDDVGLFGNTKKRKVIYLGVSQHAVKEYLQNLHEYILGHLKIASDEKYIPHTTIARIKSPYKFNNIEKKIILLLKKYNIHLSNISISLYAKVDGHMQFKMVTLHK